MTARIRRFGHSTSTRFGLAAVVVYAAVVGLPSRSLLAGDSTDAPKLTSEEEAFFETQVRPLLVERCHGCHGTKKQQGDVRLDLRTGVFGNEVLGALVKPGQVADSRIWQVLQHDANDVAMPPEGKLPAEALAIIRRWIEMGAPWPADSAEANAAAQSGSDWKLHWAFQPVQPQELPSVRNASWPRERIDHFILNRLEQAGLQPAPDADRRTLIRRLKETLLGLPATYEEIQAFQQDRRPDAYERLIEDFLSRPQYGERWARHWMDLARYADTKGYVFQEERNYPNAYRYRDWLINAFNSDLPYDQFLKLQIAADKITPDDPQQLAAMGFLTLGRRFLNNVHDITDDRIDVVCRTTQGLTVSCARCHDHKYDPIPQADYYSLYGIFRSSEEPKENAVSPLQLVDAEKPFNPRIFNRGNPRTPGEPVPRQFLEVILREDRQPAIEGSGRLEMAEAIANAGNPLTARVLVNRVWGYHFGQPLVDSQSDFGVRTPPPTHPALLDDLADRFMRAGWSVKQLHRMILLSRSFQLSSVPSADARRADPGNVLLSHMNRQRLDFEAARDAMLQAAGRLDLSVGGPSVDILSTPAPTRRSVYAYIDRQNLPGLFRIFDFAGPDTHAPKRYDTTVPQQALFLMNGPFVMEQATHLAARATGESPSQRVESLCRLSLGRDPKPAELHAMTRFITANRSKTATELPAWQYGYAAIDAEGKQLGEFQHLPHFTGKAWQGGEKLPDDKLGWVTLNQDGGHVGNNLARAAVRRWVATQDGVVQISGQVSHKKDQGDGVRVTLFKGSATPLGQWVVQNSSAETTVDGIAIKAGEAIDLVADCRSNPNHDSFHWEVRLSLQTSNGVSGPFSSKEQFAGPLPEPLDPWAALAQVLLMSNEFQFVD